MALATLNMVGYSLSFTMMQREQDWQLDTGGSKVRGP
jgi:hypothetical protein